MPNTPIASDKFDQLRRRAEALLKDRPAPDPESAPAALELINELQIHQVELEIQNEELNRAHQEISGLKQEYEDLYEFAPCGYVTLNAKGLITRVNLTAAAMFEQARTYILGNGFSRFISSGGTEAYQAARIASGRTGNPQSIELMLNSKDPSPSWVRVDMIADRNDAGEVTQWRMTLTDITESKQAELNLKKSRNLLVQAESIANMGSWEWEIINDRWTFSDNWLKIHGCTFEFSSITQEELIKIAYREDAPKIEKSFQDALKGIKPYGLEHRIVRQNDNEVRWVTALGEMIFDTSGNPVKMYGISQDITDRKRAEAALQKSLAEKEVLLREIHHRVKNNMQNIISLLRMHARRIDDARVTEIFSDCRDRVEAMSLIHEALYQSENLARIDFKTYLKKLCRNLARAHDAPRRNIDLTANVSDVTLTIDRGIAVGMIITELISNAFKHAFPHDEGGTVSVQLDRLDGDTLRLIVADTGKGLPEDFDIRNPPSLGTRLVTGAVTREMGGTIDVEGNDGARFVICFKC